VPKKKVHARKPKTREKLGSRDPATLENTTEFIDEHKQIKKNQKAPKKDVQNIFVPKNFEKKCGNKNRQLKLEKKNAGKKKT
jgi:hypothetical protein